MSLDVISRVSFGFGVIFGEKSQKRKTRKIWVKRVPTPQHREPTPRRSHMLQRGVPSPQRGRGAKMVPPRATPRRRHCLLRANFGFLFPKSRIRTPIV